MMLTEYIVDFRNDNPPTLGTTRSITNRAILRFNQATPVFVCDFLSSLILGNCEVLGIAEERLLDMALRLS